MANPEHLAILKQGVKAWNNWRRENQNKYDTSNALIRTALVIFSEKIDLTGADLFGKNFSGIDFSCVDLSGAKLINADFSNANLTNANLYGSILTGVNMTNANLAGAILRNAQFFSDLTLRDIFDNALGLNDGNFIINRNLYSLSANFSGANLSGVDLSSVNFSFFEYKETVKLSFLLLLYFGACLIFGYLFGWYIFALLLFLMIFVIYLSGFFF